MTRYDAYVAALSPGDKIAASAFDSWTAGLDPEEIDFPQHKLISIAYDRFGDQLAGRPLDGVFRNIQRQARLRAHVNFAAMSQLLGDELLKPFTIIAIGETRERLAAGEKAVSGFDMVEWAVPMADFADLVHVLERSGLKPMQSPRPAIARGAVITRMQGQLKTVFRIVGLSSSPTELEQSEGHENLFVMAPSAYWSFMTTRRASLIVRRDQILFDLVQLGWAPQREESLSRRFGIRGLAHKILGASR